MPIEKDDLTEGLANCLEELKDSKIKLDNWKAWIDSLEELSEIEDAFGIEERDKLHGKTFLDIGTDCVKPLYIALKFEPDKRKVRNQRESISGACAKRRLVL